MLDSEVPFDFGALQDAEGLALLDRQFIDYLTTKDATLAETLHAYRHHKILDKQIVSEWIIATAPYLENFIARHFHIEQSVSELKKNILSNDPIFQCKDFYLQKAKRLLKSENNFPWQTAAQAMAWVRNLLKLENDLELNIAQLGVDWLQNENQFQHEIEKLILWFVFMQTNSDAKKIIASWALFHLPHKKDFQQLVPLAPVPNDALNRLEAPRETHRSRDGFQLTDPRMSERAVLDEAHYCVYCHRNDDDFCSKGFPAKKNKPELGLKINPLGDVLTGCPLEEKISEMHYVKTQGYSIGALAIVTIDNPMCAATGHRICNDCMKACIYQKQDPVNIPQIETRVLTDVLHLPFGVEIYDLLIRWNPLRETQFLPKKYNHKNVLVMGMGPAGFTLAHHLLMEGCAVVGFDGLKIESLPEKLIQKPIRNFDDITEPLDVRVMTGFGGVAEYGITVRWDKNFLKLIYLSLARRKYFQVFGSTRFGGTVTVETAWQLGFDHVAIAVGAGLPRELPIPHSLAPGMRQANDFLMALQLTGANKKSSLANLEVRLPAVVIGGGLTGVDTATEIQAYYITQVEKIHQRYHILKSSMDEKNLRDAFDATSLTILDEFLSHAECVIAERTKAQKENRAPNFISLIREWGGVTIVYRKSISQSPAYLCNHEELSKALEEGIYYAEHAEPKSVLIDEHGYCQAIQFSARDQTELKTFPARSIFVATGAKPNIAYAYEHRDVFQKEKDHYQSFAEKSGALIPVGIPAHIKMPDFGVFTSYHENQNTVSFIGDTNPLFHGSVVKAIASAKLGYPKIMDALSHCAENKISYAQFQKNIAQQFSAEIISVERHLDNLVELTVRAPLAAQQCQAGQFYRLQNYETHAALQTEAVAALGVVDSEKPDQLSFFIREVGVSSRIIASMKVGEPIALMGPTGAKLKIAEAGETTVIMGDALTIPYLLSIGYTEKKYHARIICFIHGSKKELFALDRVHALTHEVHCIEDENNFIDAITNSTALNTAKQFHVIASFSLLKKIQSARNTVWKNKINDHAQWSAAVYAPMQCMLKGVCAQCLQWQVDPVTQKRTKAVYACSWQHQPLNIIDIDNIHDRLIQNKTQEILSNLWLDYLGSYAPR